MTNPTHKCSACLRKTIEDAEEVAHPLVLATSACPSRPGIGHAWVELVQQQGNENLSIIFLSHYLFFYYLHFLVKLN